MSWTPLIEIDSGGKSASEQQKEIDATELQKKILITLNAIQSELRLLNARFEEAFETDIEERDV
jgi:hypothetical protein